MAESVELCSPLASAGANTWFAFPFPAALVVNVADWIGIGEPLHVLLNGNRSSWTW